MTSELLNRLDAMIEAGELQPDPAQRAIAEELARLERDLAAHANSQKKAGLLTRLFGNDDKREPLKGVYIHGSVGRGKTMLMDLFFEVAPVKAKRRAHFNDFMQDVHGRIHAIRQDQRSGRVWEDADPVKLAAAAIADEASLICFDEFQVTDITDALILGRLFEALFADGVVVVATSNVAPANLYKNGLNRNAFEPFIDKFRQQLTEISLDADRDYRLGKVIGREVFLHPLGPETDAAMDDLWDVLTGGDTGSPAVLQVQGREVVVPQAAKGVARFSFADLCVAALGAADYIAVASAYKTVFVEGIPQFAENQRNEARRFITLIDTFYDRRIRLVASAEVPPDQLHPAGTHQFEFQRTVSRLTDMSSESYWSAGL